MPIYVYECDRCGLRFERRQSMTEQTLVDCPECEGHVQRVVQPVGVVFKGAGFYVTDHRKSKDKVPSESADKAAKSSAEASSKGKDAKD